MGRERSSSRTGRHVAPSATRLVLPLRRDVANAASPLASPKLAKPGPAPAADIDAEGAVLSAVLVLGAVPPALRSLRPDAFYSERHRRIWEAALAVAADDKPTDVVTVGSWLRTQGRIAQVGMGYLTEILNAAPAVSDAAVEAYAATIREKALVRLVAREAEVISATARGPTATPDDLRRRVARLGDRIDAEASGPRIETIDAANLADELPPIPWLVQSLAIAPGRPTLIAGYGFSAKSLVAQALGLAVASGTRLFGLMSVRAGRVLHLDYEQGRRLTAERYQRLARAAGVRLAELGDRLRVSVYPTLALDDAKAEEALVRLVEGHALVIVDSLTCAIPGLDENGREIAVPLYMLGRVSERTGTCFVVIHHARKPSKDAPGGAAMAIRGSSAIFGAVDSAFVFAAAKGEPVRVEHVRSPQTGILVPDFGLLVEDVEIDGEARGGLRIQHLEREQLDAAEDARVATVEARLEQQILALLAGGPFDGGRDAIRRAVKGRRDLVNGILDRLEKDGRIASEGTYHRPVIRLAVDPA